MFTDERRMELSDVLRPAAPPREIDNVYTDDQRERLLDVVRTQGPWKLIIAQHFASADELIATMSGVFPEGFNPSLDLFLTPTFRGYLANYGAVLYPELHDCFYNEPFLQWLRATGKPNTPSPSSCCSTSTGRAPIVIQGIWIRRASAVSGTRTRRLG